MKSDKIIIKKRMDMVKMADESEEEINNKLW